MSEGNIYIQGNIVYSHFRTGPNSFVTDSSVYNAMSKDVKLNKLNLVARDNVVMKRYVPDDLYIHASIFALTGQFTLEYYYSWSVVKNDLHIFGSIAQKYRGPIGTFWCWFWWCGHTGFDKKDYVYDRRLYYGPYPYKTPMMGGKLSVLDLR